LPARRAAVSCPTDGGSPRPSPGRGGAAIQRRWALVWCAGAFPVLNAKTLGGSG
jgi:hypothetical protein